MIFLFSVFLSNKLTLGVVESSQIEIAEFVKLCAGEKEFYKVIFFMSNSINYLFTKYMV